jgi:hypothetical protein
MRLLCRKSGHRKPQTVCISSRLGIPFLFKQMLMKYSSDMQHQYLNVSFTRRIQDSLIDARQPSRSTAATMQVKVTWWEVSVNTHLQENWEERRAVTVVCDQSVQYPVLNLNKQTNSVALSPRANNTDWATATCRPHLVPTFVYRGVSRGKRGGSPTVVNLSFLDRSRYFSFK